jgi:hypothetical protein
MAIKVVRGMPVEVGDRNRDSIVEGLRLHGGEVKIIPEGYK